jgi:hypothetical protein
MMTIFIRMTQVRSLPGVSEKKTQKRSVFVRKKHKNDQFLSCFTSFTFFFTLKITSTLENFQNF